MGFKEVREKHNLTQKEIAQRLGITRTTVARWECGLNYPKLKTVKQLAALYQCTIDELINV